MFEACWKHTQARLVVIIFTSAKAWPLLIIIRGNERTEGIVHAYTHVEMLSLGHLVFTSPADAESR